MNETVTPHLNKRKLYVPFALLLLLTIVTVGFYLMRTARFLNDREKEETTLLAGSALQAELKFLGNRAHDYGHGDESVFKLVVSPDPQWAAKHIGGFLARSFGICASLVFSADDDLLFAYIDGESLGEHPLLEEMRPGIEPLLQEAHKRGPGHPDAPTGLLTADQRIYLVAAHAIHPDEESRIPGLNSGVLVLIKELDGAILQRLSQAYLLPQLTLSARAPIPPRAGLALQSSGGNEIGYLQWQPEQPGTRIFYTLAPAIPVPLLLALILSLFFYHRAGQVLQERIGLHRQIEKEKQRLEESEKTLRATIEAIPSPLFFKDTAGRYLGCNQAFCDYLGLPLDQIIGHSVHDIASGELAEIYHQADLDLMRSCVAQAYEAKVRYADGRLRDILFNKACINSSHAGGIGLVGIMTDISEIKAAQEESRRLRGLLRNIIDSMPSMLVTVDEEQRVTEWNRWAARATRVKAAQAMGRPLKEVFPALFEQGIDIDAAIIDGEVRTWTRIPWKLYGQEIFVDLTAYPLDKSKGGGMVLRADDTTERAQMEKLTILGEKMMSIGSLAAGMAHEINNPLAIILQNTQIIQNRLNPQLSKNIAAATDCGIDLNRLVAYLDQRGIQDMVAAIRQAGDRAKLIVEELVNFTSRQQGHFGACDLATLVDETLHLAETDYDLKKKYAFREITITKEIPPDLEPLVCDRSEIQQVLLNLLRNSARAMREAHTEKPRISIQIHPGRKMFTLTLDDNGPGIPEKMLDRVFDPFFTTCEVGEGIGLGLSAAYFIVHEKHRGSIQALNLVEGGCRMLIKLPLDLKASATLKVSA